eukprot:TRINITY_DN3993_c0_g1_i1.p1 TRINITY_DN3993_c0_g1~~TRINITY_DN3993_c0_g1_i1.p1  ORF type:complete len:256 (+),score=42.05 TRINITY_DN3993_c0_g1_i1:417-1184(+)
MMERFYISHVSAEKGFEDSKEFYRFVPEEYSKVALDMLDWENGVSIQTRQYKYWSYTSCFIGYEAVEWIMKKYNINRSESLLIGQGLLRNHLIRHVKGKHDFKDEYLFYTFPVLKLHGHPDAPPSSMEDISHFRLAPPLPTPNCVSTQADVGDTEHFAKDGPLEISPGMTPEEIKTVLKELMTTFEGTLQNEHNHYLHFAVKIRYFTDDVEFLIVPNQNLIHYRSASRLGYGDMGVNQNRMSTIYLLWNKRLQKK